MLQLHRVRRLNPNTELNTSNHSEFLCQTDKRYVYQMFIPGRIIRKSWGFMSLKVSRDKSCFKVVSTEQRNTTFSRIVSIVSERLDKCDAVACCINPKIISFSKDVNNQTRSGQLESLMHCIQLPHYSTQYVLKDPGKNFVEGKLNQKVK